MFREKNYFCSPDKCQDYKIQILNNNTINKKPDDCNSISEIRDEIDVIDKEIIKMLGLRYKYVKKVVEYKEKTEESIVAADRREQVIAERRKWAIQNEISADAIEEMYRNLIKHFIAEEMKMVNLKSIK